MTAKALEQIGMVGGPRCCKRDSCLSIRAAVDFVEQHFQVSMENDRYVEHQNVIETQGVREESVRMKRLFCYAGKYIVRSDRKI